MKEEDIVPKRADWEMAFRWLAANELGTATVDPIPEQDQFLRQRIKTLAILFNLLPRTEVDRLPEIVIRWIERFGSQLTVSMTQLRQVAREVLTVWKEQESAELDDLWIRAVQFSRCHLKSTEAIPDPKKTPPASVEGQRKCAEGLLRWFRELKSNPQWNTLPGTVPGDADRPLSEVYVELFAIEDSEVIQRDESEPGRRAFSLDRAHGVHAISVDTMIARTLERCVVVGDPGSGKSTLVKWLVWATFRSQLPDFDVAIEIKLSAFAGALEGDANLTPLEYFFRSLGQNAEDARRAATSLRQAAIETQRYLLLLDGWDEVPVLQRRAVKEQLLHEERALITVITSRPSGMPRQLLDGQQVSCYRIAGLTPSMAEELTTKLLRQVGLSDRAITIWERIRDDIQLREMAANPFLLGLLVRTLIEPGHDGVVTRAMIYRRITSSIREQYEQVCGPEDVLSARHLEGVAELSFRLLNDPQTPRYIFARRELETSLHGLRAEPVLRSRFVTKPVSVLDEFTLLHATIQEYFAAEHMANCSAEDQRVFMERAFNSASRMIVLEFLAGLGGYASQLCQEAARRWWQSQDRFNQVTIKISRLATAGCWPLDDLGRSIRDALWAEISKEKDEDLKLCKSAIEAYAALDATDLVRRVRSKPPSSWAINCLMDAIPAVMAREHRLDQLLDGEWRDVAGLEWMGGATEAEQAELHYRLSQLDSSAADLREAVIQIGGSHDESAIPLLIDIVNCEAIREDVREEAVTSISRIGGSDAVQTILGILLNTAGSEVMARMSATAFLHPGSRRLYLDPRGRDRLLRRLASIPVTHRTVKYLLMVLDSIPIRDGAEVIAELATSSDSPLDVSQQAIAALKFVTNRRLLEDLAKWIEGRSPELILMWLKLAQERSLPIPLPWLKLRVNRCRSEIERDHLIRVLFQVLIHSRASTISEEAWFLDLLVSKSLHKDGTAVELARGLVAALSDIAQQRIVLFSEKTRTMALQFLGKSAHSNDPTIKQQLLLAVALVRHFRDASAARSVLAGILERIHIDGFSKDESIDYQIAVEIGDCLAELVPGELLRLPFDCPGVLWALRSRSLNEGWMVYADRILSAEGQEIATLKPQETPVVMTGQTVELQTLVANLSPQTRRVLESYWLMVRPSGPCHPGDSYPSIHSLAKAMYDEESEVSGIGEILRDRFPTGFPKFHAWTKQLNHVESKFAGQSEAESFLRSLGLYRR